MNSVEKRELPIQAVELVSVGESVGLILPPDVLAKLGVGVGDTVFISETPEGCLVTLSEPGVTGTMDFAREIMERRRQALVRLAATQTRILADHEATSRVLAK